MNLFDLLGIDGVASFLVGYGDAAEMAAKHLRRILREMESSLMEKS